MTRSLVAAALLATATPALATRIDVGPSDAEGWKKIEAAQPGDEVVLAPGTYGFRVQLKVQAPSTNPIVIRAADPAHRPVWDFGAARTRPRSCTSRTARPAPRRWPPRSPTTWSLPRRPRSPSTPPPAPP